MFSFCFKFLIYLLPFFFFFFFYFFLSLLLLLLLLLLHLLPLLLLPQTFFLSHLTSITFFLSFFFRLPYHCLFFSLLFFHHEGVEWSGWREEDLQGQCVTVSYSAGWSLLVSSHPVSSGNGRVTFPVN